MEYEKNIARIEAFRARRIGEMLVTSTDAEFQAEPEQVLYDYAERDGRDLLKDFHARGAVYATTPFDPAGDCLRIYPGGVTIWSGFPGSGKTTLIRQMICQTLHRGSSVFFASLEEHPGDALVRLAMTAAGTESLTAHQMQWFIDAYGERMRLWGVIGLAQHVRLLGCIRELASKGIKHAFIDSLMCLDIRNDDFEAQRRFATLLAATARAAKIHIHLIAHPRKLVSASQELDLNDVAGARELGGIADNVIFVRRADNETADPKAKTTQMLVSIKKQRHGTGWLGNIGCWFHRDFRQLAPDHPTMERAPKRYLPDDAYASIASRGTDGVGS